MGSEHGGFGAKYLAAPVSMKFSNRGRKVALIGSFQTVLMGIISRTVLRPERASAPPQMLVVPARLGNMKLNP